MTIQKKQIIFFIVAICSFMIFGFSLADTIPVFSGGGLKEGADIVKNNIQGTGLVEEGNLVETIIWAIKWLLVISGILAFLAFLYAGFLYITSYINDKNPETAKKAMINTAIGILIIIFSWVLVNFLTTLTFS